MHHFKLIWGPLLHELGSGSISQQRLMVDIGGSSQLRLHMLAVVTLNIWQSLTHANFWRHVFSSSSAARSRFLFLWDALLMNESIYNSILSQLILRLLSTQNGIRSEPLTHRPARCDSSPRSGARSLASVLHSEILIIQHILVPVSTWLRHRESPTLRLLLKTLIKQLLLASN